MRLLAARTRPPIARFLADETGSITIEAIIMLPILVWCYVASYAFFDGYRAASINVRTAYTVLDTLSRETGYITDDYMNGLVALEDYLTGNMTNVGLQVTVFHYDDGTSGGGAGYRANWSRSRGSMPTLTTSELNDLSSNLPDMTDGEVAILVRTRVHYNTKFESSFTGLLDQDMTQLMVMRPRFAGQLCWNSREDGDESTATC